MAVENERTVTAMAEYIARESAIEAIMSDPPDAHYQSWYAEKINEIPAADVAPVRQWQWEWDTEDIYRCSNCAEKSHVKEVMGHPEWDYCPNCGAKMDGGDSNSDMT